MKRTDVDKIIQELERYKSSFVLSLQVDQTSTVIDLTQTTVRIDRNIDLEKLPIVRGAEFDSYMDQHEDDCLQGTREELYRQITEWVRSTAGKMHFLVEWWNGTGKSTISRTMAKTFKTENLLGASFFFKRDEGDRGNATKLSPTITRQLVKSIPQLIPGVQKAIHDDSDIATKGLKEQFDKILLHPLLSLNLSAPIPNCSDSD